MDSATQGPAKESPKPVEADTIGKLTDVLAQDTYKNDEVYVELPDGGYRRVVAVNTYDDTYVLILDSIAAEPYAHEE